MAGRRPKVPAPAPDPPPPLWPVAAEFTFSQEADCCDGGPDDQVLTVKVEDGGGGCFPVLATERWAMEPDEMAALLRWCVGRCRSVFDGPENGSA